MLKAKIAKREEEARKKDNLGKFMVCVCVRVHVLMNTSELINIIANLTLLIG